MCVLLELNLCLVVQVSECGMSDTVGPIFIDTESQRPSHDIQKSIDAEVCLLRKHFSICELFVDSCRGQKIQPMIFGLAKCCNQQLIISYLPFFYFDHGSVSYQPFNCKTSQASCQKGELSQQTSSIVVCKILL
jgi:hypothetical protein